MTYKIEKVVRERLSQVPRARSFTCRDCGEDILFIRVQGGTVAVDMELRTHVCDEAAKRDHQRKYGERG
jgi:hypothetical protein